MFAPTNAAFDALPPGQLEDLLKPANKQQLADILSYHVVDGEFLAADLEDGQSVPTLPGEDLEITVDASVLVNGVPVDQADVQAGNGVVHVIGEVLTPPGWLRLCGNRRGFMPVLCPRGFVWVGKRVALFGHFGPPRVLRS